MQPGTSINHYRIVGELGAGGMGQVYRAEDTRLKRQVAIKVLPPELARDPERLARMEREAQVLAALNHPHVAAIYGLEEAHDPSGESTRFLVMELVEGESLAQRITAAGAMPPETVIEIARGIARGLEAAHEKGIVHRDLKPANVMLGEDGSVKVLDFGLAKAAEGSGSVSSELSASPTVMGTQAGVILGTASYMSPEQARGKAVDKRADIWAFGCVLFEMLGGRRPFDGDTVTDIIAAVVRAEPDVDDLPASTPPRLRELVRRCLVKDPAQRLRDIGDARIELDHVHEQPIATAAQVASPEAAVATRPTWIAAAAVAGLLLGAGAAMLMRSEPPPPPVRRAMLADQASIPLPIAVSPAGDALVYVGSDGLLHLRWLAEATDMRLEGTQGALNPAWSADDLVYFMQDGALRRINVRAGGAVTVAEPPESPWFMLALGDDGTAYVSGADFGGQKFFIHAVDTATGTSREIAQWNGADARFFVVSQLVSGGSVLLGVGVDTPSPGTASATVELLRLADGTRTVVATGYAYPLLLDSGELLMIDPDGRLVSTRLDLSTGKLAGVPVPRIEGLAILNGFFAGYTVSSDGSIFYIGGEGSAANERSLQWLDRKGGSTEISSKHNFYDTDSRISPDDRYLALERSDVNQVWIHDVQRDTQAPLNTDEISSFPVWSPDGKLLAVAMSQPKDGAPGIFLLAVDRSAPPRRLTEAAEGRFHLPMDWNREGGILYIDSDNPLRGGQGNDIWIVAADEDAEPRSFLATSASEVEARFSPDGRWIAYESDHSGRAEVYVRPADGAGGEIPISTDGGWRPSWNPAGGELFYYAGGADNARRFMSVRIDTVAGFSADVPEEVFRLPVGFQIFLIEPDATGQRFFTVSSISQDAPNRLLAIFNWTQTLTR